VPRRCELRRCAPRRCAPRGVGDDRSDPGGAFSSPHHRSPKLLTGISIPSSRSSPSSQTFSLLTSHTLDSKRTRTCRRSCRQCKRSPGRALSSVRRHAHWYLTDINFLCPHTRRVPDNHTTTIHVCAGESGPLWALIEYSPTSIPYQAIIVSYKFDNRS
jgi:hypothetical protein